MLKGKIKKITKKKDLSQSGLTCKARDSTLDLDNLNKEKNNEGQSSINIMLNDEIETNQF